MSFLPGGDASLLSTNPQIGLEGKFSIKYIVAAVLLNGGLKVATFTDVMVQRPEARQLMQHVHRIHIRDEKFYSGIADYNNITVVTRSGQFKVREDRVPGSRAWPMNGQEREAKFMDCSSTVLGETAAADLHKQINQIAIADNIRMMMKATVPLPSLHS